MSLFCLMEFIVDQNFKKLAEIFEENGFNLYLVGGCVRDGLLGIKNFDFDACTDATPDDIKKFIEYADYTFEKYGSTKIIFNDVTFEVTTFRKEKSYNDSRHPTKIKFIKNKRIDSKRRDFTINALYVDKNGKIYDYHHGLRDLNKKVIRTIGNPAKRIKEDPLRIIRAIRFSIILDFKIDKKLEKTIKLYAKLLLKLKRAKIVAELKKVSGFALIKLGTYFNKYGVNKYIDMIN